MSNKEEPLIDSRTNFVIFTKSYRSAKRVFASVTRYLTDRLRLVVNQTKSRQAYWHMPRPSPVASA